jgi:2-amino-4-hydroxy-6-hydroxymethyldihydropteridine diphosphokinase
MRCNDESGEKRHDESLTGRQPDYLQHWTELLARMLELASVANEAPRSMGPLVLDSMECVIGIGANIGDRDGTFAWALGELNCLGQILAISNIYENPAVGGPPQPDYLNAAVRLGSALTPLELLRAVQRVECLAGRERDIHWGPRTLDLDLLWIPHVTIDSPELQLPHPRLNERAFALLPLIEVAPHAADPTTRIAYSTLLECGGAEELRLYANASGPPWNWHRLRSRTRDDSRSTLAAP